MENKRSEKVEDMEYGTPGPWQAIGLDGYCRRKIVGPEGRCIAIVDDGGEKLRRLEMECNAMLIAAAPDLLGALVELIEIVEDIRSGDGRIDSFTLQPARAAIARTGFRGQLGFTEKRGTEDSMRELAKLDDVVKEIAAKVAALEKLVCGPSNSWNKRSFIDRLNYHWKHIHKLEEDLGSRDQAGMEEGSSELEEGKIRTGGKRGIALARCLLEISAEFDDPVVHAVAKLIGVGMPVEAAIVEGFKALASCNRELKSLLVKTSEWNSPPPVIVGDDCTWLPKSAGKESNDGR
jgi:hypothetical protein